MVIMHIILLLILLSGFGIWASFMKTEHMYRKVNVIFQPAWMDEKLFERSGFRAPFISLIEKKYLVDTGIRWFLPNLSLGALIMICILSALFGGWLGATFTGIIGMMLPGCFLFGVLPIKMIYFWKAYQEQSLRAILPLIFGILGKWASLQPDLYFCLNKLVEAKTHPLVTKTLMRFQTDLASGCSAELAFDRLEGAVGGGLLKEFYVCLSQIERNRGDLLRLIEGFEQEAFHVEMEVSKRRAENFKQMLLISLLNGAGFVFLFLLLSSNRVLSDFYIGTAGGNFVITIVAMIFVVIFLESTRFYENAM